MLDLSAPAVDDWVSARPSSFGDAISQAQQLETWPCDADASVGEAATALGAAIDDALKKLGAEAFLGICTPAFVTDLRIALAYLGVSRRLRALQWLAAIESPYGERISTLLLDPADAQTSSPRAEEGEPESRRSILSPEDAARVLRACIRHIARRRLIHEVFAPDRIELILRATSGS